MWDFIASTDQSSCFQSAHMMHNPSGGLGWKCIDGAMLSCTTRALPPQPAKAKSYSGCTCGVCWLSLHAAALWAFFLSFFKFAENACGMVQVVLNGSISNTFDKNRYLFLCILFARVSSASYLIVQLQKNTRLTFKVIKIWAKKG